MVTHRERVETLKELLEVCHKKEWTYDTKAVADKIAPYVKAMGFAQVSVRTMVASVVDILLIEKQTGKPWTYGP